MPFKVTGASSGNVAEVDANRQLFVTPTTNPAMAGYVRVVDSEGNQIETTEDGYLRTSAPDIIFADSVDGNSVDINTYSQSVSTMTIAQASGYLTLNAGASVAASGYAILQSLKFVPLYGTLPSIVAFNAWPKNLPQANCTAEIGVGTATTTSAPTDGAFFRWRPDGTFACVINNGGSETTSVPAIGNSILDSDGNPVVIPPVTTDVHLFEIEIVEDHIQFSIDDALVADIQVPPGGAYPFNSGRQQLFARVYVSGSPASFAPSISVGQITVLQEDMNQNRTWLQYLAGQGAGAYQLPVSPFGQTANHANSTNPTSAILSNTAAGYSTFGGRFQFAAPAGAATDYALFTWQNTTGYQLFIANISISSVNTGAGVLVTPTILEWDLAVNSSAVSLATSDAAGVWGPRRTPLGMQSWSVGSLAGAMATDITRSFPVYQVVDSGRYLHVIVQVPVGTATASQVIRGTVTINAVAE